MAALQHRLAVVGTDGPLTDPLLRDPSAGLWLVPAQSAAAFATAAVELAQDESSRSRRASLGHQFYRRHFDWPVLANRILGALADCMRERRQLAGTDAA
jgi:glycosyltransferase involved in cell wall biosynthesis